MIGDNIIKATRVIGRNGITEYRVDVRSVLAIPDYEQNIPDKFIAASLANQLREFVNSSVLDERVETEYRKLTDGCTCPCCGRKVDGNDDELTCHLVEDENMYLVEEGDLSHCSNCGGSAAKQSWAYWNYCPNCGAKVMGE